MNEQEIKVYKDAYADASYAKVGFKGKTIGPSGIIYISFGKKNQLSLAVDCFIVHIRNRQNFVNLLVGLLINLLYLNQNVKRKN